MNKLSKSTWLLIGLLIAITALGTILIVTMPREYVNFFEGHMLSKFSRTELLNNEYFSNENGELDTNALNRAHYFHYKPHGSVFLFIIAGIAIFIIIGAVHKKKRFRYMYKHRNNLSVEILEEQYAEGKISKEELLRKRKIIEE